MITITGLTRKQVKLLDIMWAMDDVEVYENWKNGLTEEIMNEVDTLEQMVILATLDQEVENLESFDEAAEMLSKYRG